MAGSVNTVFKGSNSVLKDNVSTMKSSVLVDNWRDFIVSTSQLKRWMVQDKI